MNTWIIAGLAVLALAAPAVAAPAFKPYLATALADPARAADQGADARRKPGEIVAFSGLKPGDKVVDLIPGGGYFTRIFAKVVGPKGHVYAIWPAEYAKVAQPDPDNSRKLAQTPGYENVSVIEQPGAAFAPPGPVNMVFTSQNYHDYPDELMGKIDPMTLDRAVYKALKPGGVFLIVDHVAQGGSGMRDTDTLHRIDPAIVKQQVIAAGFVRSRARATRYATQPTPTPSSSSTRRSAATPTSVHLPVPQAALEAEGEKFRWMSVSSQSNRLLQRTGCDRRLWEDCRYVEDDDGRAGRPAWAARRFWRAPPPPPWLRVPTCRPGSSSASRTITRRRREPMRWIRTTPR